MKKIISFILIFSLFFSTLSFADCQFSTGITKLSDNSFSYTKECHIYVGQMVQDLEKLKLQNDKLFQAIDLKDKALNKADERADLWREASFKLEDRINTIDKMRQTNSWLYFGLGALTFLAAGYVSAQFYQH